MPACEAGLTAEGGGDLDQPRHLALRHPPAAGAAPREVPVRPGLPPDVPAGFSSVPFADTVTAWMPSFPMTAAPRPRATAVAAMDRKNRPAPRHHEKTARPSPHDPHNAGKDTHRWRHRRNVRNADRRPRAANRRRRDRRTGSGEPPTQGTARQGKATPRTAHRAAKPSKAAPDGGRGNGATRRGETLHPLPDAPRGFPRSRFSGPGGCRADFDGGLVGPCPAAGPAACAWAVMRPLGRRKHSRMSVGAARAGAHLSGPGPRPRSLALTCSLSHSASLSNSNSPAFV